MQQVLWPSGFIALEVKANGVSLASNITCLDFIGAGVSVAINGTCAEVTIPGGGGGGFTLQDGLGVVVPGVTTLELPVGSVAAGGPGVGQILTAPVRVSDFLGNVAIYDTINFPNMAAIAAGPGVVDVFGMTPPTPAEQLFTAIATGGGQDLEYAGGLQFIGGSRTPQFFQAPRFDTSLGYTIFEFEPNSNPLGAGNGFLWVGQAALIGSGTSGGDVGLQAGLSDVGAIGGGAFIQAGASLGGLADAGFAELRAAGGATVVQVGGPNQSVSFNGVTPPPPVPVVVGSRGGNAALASLLTQLAATGLIVDSSTP